MLVPSLVPPVSSPTANGRIRVLVVDDSVVIRRLISQVLSEDDELEVVGVAADGKVALQRIEQLKPDALTLDIEMPEMDGLETLRHIRKLYPHLRVIMFSTLTERGASVTLEALALGASDYVTKASNAGSLDKSRAALRNELTPKIKQFFGRRGAHQLKPPAPQVAVVGKPAAPPARRTVTLVPRIVAIGVSTGGPNALAALVPQFPKRFPLPILIVQHMPPLFTRILADRLNTHSEIKVEEVSDGVHLEPGKALIAAGGFHMRICKHGESMIAKMDQEPPENSCRPAVDVTFRSVAEVVGGAAVAVVLTGMGNDGQRGAAHLRELGAYIIAQDEPSSVVWGMPGAVVRAGLADAVVDLSSVVPEILKKV